MTLAEIEAMLEATTPGEWELVKDYAGGPKRSWWEIRSGRRPVVQCAEFTRHRDGEEEVNSGVQMSEADAKFLAASKAIVLQLLSERRQLMDKLDAVGEAAARAETKLDNMLATSAATNKKLCAINGVNYQEWCACHQEEEDT